MDDGGDMQLTMIEKNSRAVRAKRDSNIIKLRGGKNI